MASVQRGLSRLGGRRARYADIIRRLLLAYDPRTLEAPIAERLRAAQFQAATRQTMLMLLANVMNASVIVIVAASGTRFWPAVAWATLITPWLRPL